MLEELVGDTETEQWHMMVDVAKKGAEQNGYSLKPLKGRGGTNVFELSKGGQQLTAAIRTTRDRWIAFPPLEKGSKWKTLDDVDLVLVSAVDDKENPQNIEVYLFPADEVRSRFAEAYEARIAANRKIRDNFGMWVALDPKEGMPKKAGSGLAAKHQPIAKFSVSALGSAPAVAKPSATKAPETIGEIMASARERIARAAGVKVEAVKLDLKVEY